MPRVLEKAKENCFVSNSIKSKIIIEPEVFHQQTAASPCPLGLPLSGLNESRHYSAKLSDCTNARILPRRTSQLSRVPILISSASRQKVLELS
jgi:hypothetical protein